MSQQLESGDRVRIKAPSAASGHEAGLTGSVIGGPHMVPNSTSYYLVSLENDPSGRPSVFAVDEIELDT